MATDVVKQIRKTIPVETDTVCYSGCSLGKGEKKTEEKDDQKPNHSHPRNYG